MSPVIGPETLFIFVFINKVAMPENSINEKESLQIIQEMIQTARNQYSENGHLYLIWGWVILVCSVAHFLLDQYFHFEGFSKVWLLTWVALGYQFIYLSKKKGQMKVRTFADTVMKYVWTAFPIALFLSGFAIIYISGKQGMNVYAVLYPVFLALYGIPTFISGQVLKVPSLKWGGVICWGLSLASIFIPSGYQILLLGVAGIFAWIKPGFSLQLQYKKLNS